MQTDRVMERMFKTSEESYEALWSIESQINAAINNPQEPWETVEKLEKERAKIIRNLIPDVGTKGTIIYYSDRRAVTVVEVNERGDMVGVQFNKTICKDFFGNDYEILPELDDFYRIQYFSKRRSGRWRAVGYPDKPCHIQLCIHFHVHSIDPTY